MVRAIVAFDRDDAKTCLENMQRVALYQQSLMKVFYEALHDKNISRSVWLSYVQGFQGWGAGRLIDGEFVKFDGISGSHVLIFQALDAFLGLDRYLTDENMNRYIPARQRVFCDRLRAHCFRDSIGSSMVDVQIGQQFDTILKQMRVSISIQPGESPFVLMLTQVFRAAHRTRVMPYLQQPAPERQVMTAGKGVLEMPGEKASMEHILKPLDHMMLGRLHQTI